MQGTPSAQPVRHVWVDASQYMPPGHGNPSAQAGGGSTQPPFVQVAPDAQSAFVAHPGWHIPEDELQWCPAGQASTRQLDGAGTHSCVEASQSLPVPQTASEEQPERQTPVVVSQYVRGAGHPVRRQSLLASHSPEMQSWPVAQAWPQVPQFCGSIRRSAQLPPSGWGPASGTDPPSGAEARGTQTFASHACPATQSESWWQVFVAHQLAQEEVSRARAASD
jgi:hypothetical protein